MSASHATPEHARTDLPPNPVTGNIPTRTIEAERAARLMAATAKAAPDLKPLAGGARGGRNLAKPVLHYSLS